MKNVKKMLGITLCVLLSLGSFGCATSVPITAPVAISFQPNLTTDDVSLEQYQFNVYSSDGQFLAQLLSEPLKNGQSQSFDVNLESPQSTRLQSLGIRPETFRFSWYKNPCASCIGIQVEFDRMITLVEPVSSDVSSTPAAPATAIATIMANVVEPVTSIVSFTATSLSTVFTVPTAKFRLRNYRQQLVVGDLPTILPIFYANEAGFYVKVERISPAPLATNILVAKNAPKT